MQIHYPNNIEELKDGNEYQIQMPMSKKWSQPKIYSSNICKTRKNNIMYLIEQIRLRILKK